MKIRYFLILLSAYCVIGSPCVAANLSADAVLVEAEHFQDKGGWKIDTQFSDVMGSAYLLAHGLGRPVENARTLVSFPSAGTYTLWVRTKDWAPGNWQSPGRFQVVIDGATVKTVFGVKTGWRWRSGGLVEITDTHAMVELQDLTGFDGRCDAMFFTKDASVAPPNDLKKMRLWRNQLSGMGEAPAVVKEFDVVIVGGGIAGCAAALAAAEQGLNVALIHDRSVLGGNASGEVRVHTIGITGKGDELLKKINTKHWPNGSAKALAEDVKRHKVMDAEAGIRQFLGWRAYDAAAKDGRIVYVDARQIESGKTQRFRAPVFIDCTGDGWVGFWAGAEYRYGRESRNEFKEGWDAHGELWSPEKPDNRVMGSSLLWYSRIADCEVKFPDVPWAMPVAKDLARLKGEWFWEYSDNQKHQIDNAEGIRDHIMRAIYGSFANAKKDPKNANMALDWMGFVLGKRESRRLVGDYIYTMNDMVLGRQFPDAVVEETRDIDLHYQRTLKDTPYDFLSEALFKDVDMYYVPFRCLYSKNITNLMMAGRCFSCSHVGLGGPRVMNTTGQMGIATGYAASLCKKYNTTPRGVYQKHITELRKLVGYE